MPERMTQRLAATIVGAALCGSAVTGVSQAQTAPRPEEIVVTGSIVPIPKREIGTAVSVIDGPAIELRGYDALADVLRTQPGIGVSNSGGPGKATTVRIRGEEGYRSLLMIDGIKVTDPSGTQQGPSFDSLLTTNDMERVEILRGPQGFIYGADAGGVVNVITGKGAGPFGGRFSIEAGEFDTRKVTGSLSGGNDDGDFYLSAADLDTDGFNSQAADTTLRDDDGAKNTTLHTKLGWNATENLRLQLVARTVDASTLYDGCFTPSFAPTDDCVGSTDQTLYKVSADYRTGKLTNTFGVSDVDIVRQDFAADQPTFGSHGDLERLEYTGSYVASAATTLVYGIDLQDEHVASDGTLDRDQNAAYVEYQGKYGDALFLSLGARRDDNDDFGSHTSSRASIAYVQDLSGGNALKYRASYGTGFRAPSLFEIAYNRGPFSSPPAAGLALSEETSEGYDLGIEVDSANGLHFEVTYFDQDISDEIFFDLDAFSGYLQSRGTSASKGVELGLTAPLGPRWQLIANWTNNDTENTDNTQRVYRPKDLGNFGLLYASLDDALRFVANYRIARDSIAIGGIGFDDYEVLDLSLAYSVNDTLEVFGRLQNATDEDFQEVAGYNTAGREVYGGVRLRF